jgi:chemotaxis protein CheX
MEAGTMKVEYINPFIESVYDLFTTMLGSTAKRGVLGLSRGDSDPSEITALIGLSGPARGVVALSFPVATALAISNRLSGMESRVVDDTVSDAIAEVVNIVAGGAKGKFKLGDCPSIDLSLPSIGIVRGKNYNVEYPTSTTWLEVPFESDLGPFNMRVVFEMTTTEAHEG